MTSSGSRPVRLFGSLLAAVVIAAVVVVADPVAAQQSRVVLPPQAQTDCTGDVAIVVASDAAAESDLYSAVTLAGVIGTDCIVRASARDEPMPADQQARLDTAQTGGFIVGGTASVPDAKTAGRNMTRLAGSERWHTAVSVGGSHVCALRTDRTATCWGNNEHGQAEPPTGTYTAIDTGKSHTCALRTDGTIACWGSNNLGKTDAPAGTFTAIDTGFFHTCALRTDGTLECWATSWWSAVNADASAHEARHLFEARMPRPHAPGQAAARTDRSCSGAAGAQGSRPARSCPDRGGS